MGGVDEGHDFTMYPSVAGGLGAVLRYILDRDSRENVVWRVAFWVAFGPNALTVGR